MRVLLRDGTTQFRWITINVIQQIAPPQPPAKVMRPVPRMKVRMMRRVWCIATAVLFHHRIAVASARAASSVQDCLSTSLASEW